MRREATDHPIRFVYHVALVHQSRLLMSVCLRRTSSCYMENTAEEKGVKEKGVKEKGVKEKGVKEKAAKKKGVKEKAAKENACRQPCRLALLGLVIPICLDN